MNNIGTIHLKDYNFDLSQAEESELLIKVSPKRLSYAIINASKQVSVLFDTALEMSLTETIDELLSENEYLKQPYKAVKILTETFNFTFIPNELYSPANLSVYKALFAKKASDNVQVNHIKKAEIRNAFALQEELTETLFESYPNARIYSQAEPLIDGMMYNYQGEKLILQFNDSSFELLIIDNHLVRFYNIFQLHSPDDFNYYLLFVLQQLGLTETDFEVILSGDIDKENLLYKRIEKYYNKISFASNIRLAKLGNTFSSVPEHQFFTLFNLYLCE
ncbi:DUF3822 family protein [Desertivirga arenae]|uniref:DUF3822 family protein n=1 Tax=Desertivirga arenae TaxID=2810309 RepID=UPI001A95ADD4|nr:DUF3822 family protein [Pedobacter sp. SYSU D00823]